MIALTFDDGPSEHTEKILDLLEQYNSRATFCVLGNRVDRYAETIKRAAEMGCEVVGHSWDHKYLTKLTPDGIREELTSTNQALYDATGYWPPYYRPPYGAMNDAVREVTIELNLSMLLWSIDPRDWQSRNADEICAIINDKARDGGIIICHDIYGSTVEAMERAIPGLIDMGYQLVTVSELLGGRTIEPGSEILRR
jgi:peptidoglycan/xylan/chitin deacetylase (PgdA/CDA1 family)